VYLKVGARQGTVKEQIVWAYEYPIQWREPSLNLTELARLRWINRISIKELARRFGKSKSSIDYHLGMIKKKNFHLVGLTETERDGIIRKCKIN